DRKAALRSALDAALDVAAGHVAGDDEELSGLLAHVVDRDDVGVVAQASHRLRLAAHAQEPRLVEALRVEQRHRDLAIEQRVAREVDALLRAAAEEALDAVAPRGERDRGIDRFSAVPRTVSRRLR